MKKKISIVFAIVFLALFCSFLQAGRLPNIVLIMVDDMGYGDPSCYNPASKIKTPAIDALAGQGIRFLDAHAGGNFCIPSRYALMTGRFAVRSDLNLSKGPLIDKGRMTIASLLNDHGYRTAMVGKWHLGFDQFFPGKKPVDYSVPFNGGPVDCGFDSFFGMHASLDIPPYFYIRNRKPVTPPTEDIAANNSVGGPEGWNNIQGAFWRAGKIAPDFELTKVTDRYIDEAVNVINYHNTRADVSPLFLYLALPSPHTPWLPSDQFRGKSAAGMYGDFVMQIDAAVGKVISTIDRLGMTDNTLIILTSDNGPVWYDKDRKKFSHSSAGKLKGMKFDSWEGGHRMPFIVRWPGKVSPGTTSSQTIEFSDLLATFADIVGLEHIPAGNAEDSRSFLACMDSTSKISKRDFIIHDKNTIRDGDWKLILPKNNKQKQANPNGELYNLSDDISEQNNLIEKYPDIAQKLKARLDNYLSSIK